MNTDVKLDGENALSAAEHFSDCVVGTMPEPVAVAGVLRVPQARINAKIFLGTCWHY